MYRSAAPAWYRSSAGDFFDELDDVPPTSPDQKGQELNEEYRPTIEELAASAGEWDERIAQFNRVTMVGRVGNDPDPRYFDDGKVVLSLSLAVKRKYHSLERKAYNIKSGEEETDWYGLEIWGRDAEYAAKYVKKGARIGVVGSLQLDEWTDRATGEPRNAAKIIVKDLDILETRAESELRQSNQRGDQRGPSFYTNDDDDDDDDDETFSRGTGGFFD
jgi:single-strand DNA-binding protein